MKTISFLSLILILICSCSKKVDNVDPKPIIEPSSFEQKILQAIKDTTGLKLSYCNTESSDLFVLGTKHKKLWCGFLEYKDNSLQEKYIWTGQQDFIDTINIIEEYGQRDTFRLSLNKTFSEKNVCSYLFFNKDTFAIQTLNFPAIFICNNQSYLSTHCIKTKWTNGYYMTESLINSTHSNNFISDCKGNKIYKLKAIYGDMIPISLYYFLKKDKSDNNYFYTKTDARTDESKWYLRINNIGKIIEGSYPEIREEYISNEQEIIFRFHITNFDGSEEVKDIRVDQETGKTL